MYTNLDIVNLALRKAGFSSRINPASNDMIEDAWEDLKLLIAELSTPLPLLGAYFNQSGLDEPSGLADSWINGVAYELAKRIQPDYESILGQDFLTAAYAARESLNIALMDVPNLERRTDMPVGAGWKQPVDLNFYWRENKCR